MYRDLTGNNLVPMLLNERRELKKILNGAKHAEMRFKAINDTLKELMGDATKAALPGWKLEIRSQSRGEYTVQAKTIKTLWVTEKPERLAVVDENGERAIAGGAELW